jgi:hypothetical protein
MQSLTWLNDLIVDAMKLAVVLALAFGATFAGRLLQACLDIGVAIHRALFPDAAPSPWPGMALFFFLLMGAPVLAVIWGFATGRLPVDPCGPSCH